MNPGKYTALRVRAFGVNKLLDILWEGRVRSCAVFPTSKQAVACLQLCGADEARRHLVGEHLPEA